MYFISRKVKYVRKNNNEMSQIKHVEQRYRTQRLVQPKAKTLLSGLRRLEQKAVQHSPTAGAHTYTVKLQSDCIDQSNNVKHVITAPLSVRSP